MGVVYYKFPSGTTTIPTPAGEVAVWLIFERAATSGTVGQNEYFEISPIDYDLSFDSSSNTAKLARCTITFSNHTGTFSNAWSMDFFDAVDDPTEIFCQVYIDGSVFFDGVIDFLNYKKSDYYYDTGTSTLKYRTVTIPFLDKVKYLDKLTLSDVSYIDGMDVIDLIGNMATALNLTLDYDYCDFVTEEFADVDYTLCSPFLTAFQITGLNETDNALKILKELSKAFGFMFYSQSGYLVIESRNAGNLIALDFTDNSVLKIEKIEKRQLIKYVSVGCQKDWNCYSLNPDAKRFPNDTRQFCIGETADSVPGANDAQNFILDTTGIFDKIHVPCPAAGPAILPEDLIDDAADSTTKDREIEINTWQNWTGSFDDADNECESGMPVALSESVNDLKQRWYSIVSEVTGELSFDIFANDHTANDLIGYSDDEKTSILRYGIFNRPFDNYSFIYKMYPCLKVAAEIYWQAMAGENIFKVTERGFKFLTNNPIIESKNYKIIRAKYDFDRDVTEYECEEIATLKTAAAVQQTNVTGSDRTVMALVEGGIRIGAAQIQAHFTDKNFHFSRGGSGDGFTYLKLVTNKDNPVYMYLVEDNKGRVYVDFLKVAPK